MPISNKTFCNQFQNSSFRRASQVLLLLALAMPSYTVHGATDSNPLHRQIEKACGEMTEEQYSAIKSRYVQEAREFWAELQSFKNEPQFSQVGYAGGKYADWEKRRQAAYEEWQALSVTLPSKYRYQFTFGEALYFMHVLGKNYYRFNGKISDSNKPMLEMIEEQLAL